MPRPTEAVDQQDGETRGASGADVAQKEEVKSTLRRGLAGSRPAIQHVAEDLCLGVRTSQRETREPGVAVLAVPGHPLSPTLP
jgi:hypothetical protein